LAPATIPIKLTSSCNRRNISSSSTLIPATDTWSHAH
jgi:hypothetical protein